jgi:hypothetical protein
MRIVYGSPSSRSGSLSGSIGICVMSSATSAKKMSPAEAVAVAVTTTISRAPSPKRSQNLRSAGS